MTLQQIELGGSDLFYGLNQMQTSDLGNTWTDATPIPGFERRSFQDKYEVTVCDFTPQWHAASGKLLGTGHTVVYENNKLLKVRPRATAYAVCDPNSRTWTPWRQLEMPADPKFANVGAGSTQRYDLPDGNILLPVYFRRDVSTFIGMFSTVVLCRFDGDRLCYLTHGSELTVDVARGLGEPSLACFQNRFYLTLRNDERGYVAASADGLHFGEPKPWTWDDGSCLGNYNTQQHWVTHSEGLFLAYTRRGAENDHIFRHRAPLFIAQVDPEKLHVIRSTERILMPNRGARLGNFGVTPVSSGETWITDAEWMQPMGCEKYGSDGTVWVSKIRWNKPNALMG